MGAHILANVLEPLIARADVLVNAANEREPRYRAEGRMIVSVHTGRRQTPPLARDALAYLIEGALATQHDDLVETDIAMIGDLIRAIREAERNDPLPPAAMAKAA